SATVLASCFQPTSFRWIVKGWPALTFKTLPPPTTLRFTKYGTCALVSPFWSTCTTCQPPSPSGMVTSLDSVPSGAAVAVPSGTETNVQHVPVQLTRLPTTVDQTRLTGALGVSPEAVAPTCEGRAPAVEVSLAVAVVEGAGPVAIIVVRASGVGVTLAGQSIRVGGAPASFVTVNVKRPPTAHGMGDCGMFR